MIPGINIHGYFLSEIGLGHSARLFYKALTTRRYPITACQIFTNNERNNIPEFANIISNEKLNYINISILGLSSLKDFTKKLSSKNVIIPFWELEKINKNYISYLRKYDLILSPSMYITTILREYSLDNILHIRHPIDVTSGPRVQTQLKSQKLSFLCVLDTDSYIARKNPLGAVLAFKEAFQSDEDVSLTIKIRGTKDCENRRLLKKISLTDPRISIIDKFYTNDEIKKLLSNHDVYLSLHRSEGLGLCVAEAMSFKKIVVATNYGGTVEFINKKTGFPIDYTMTNIKKNEYIMSENCQWAEPSIQHASEALMYIYRNLDKAQEIAQNGYEHIKSNYDYRTTSKIIIDALESYY